jgi:tripartite-type tricarboxylate transporter receptor subunit TctC
MKKFLAGLAIACLLGAPAADAADSFPQRPIRIVIGFGPGGLADVTMRIIAQKLTETTGQQVIIENKPGAGGVLAANTVLQSKPDGYTLLVLTNGTAITKSLFKTLPFDPEKDFAPISTVAYFDVLLLVKGDSPYKSLKDMLEAAKASSGGFNIGTINPGSTQNLSGELFKSTTNMNATVVPFRGTPDVLTGLLRGDVVLGFETYAALKSAIDQNQIRALATSAPTRSPILPNVPTVKESGIDYVVTGWNALGAPATTPHEIVDYLNKKVTEAVNAPDVHKRILELGTEPRASTPRELADRMTADVKKWAEVIKRAGIEQQ